MRVAGLFRPDAGGTFRLGEMFCFDAEAEDLGAVHRRRLGYVFQEDGCFALSRFGRNLLLRSLVRARQTRRLCRCSSPCWAIGGLRDRRAGGLSGGEKRFGPLAGFAGNRRLLLRTSRCSLMKSGKPKLCAYLDGW